MDTVHTMLTWMVNYSEETVFILRKIFKASQIKRPNDPWNLKYRNWQVTVVEKRVRPSQETAKATAMHNERKFCLHPAWNLLSAVRETKHRLFLRTLSWTYQSQVIFLPLFGKKALFLRQMCRLCTEWTNGRDRLFYGWALPLFSRFPRNATI